MLSACCQGLGGMKQLGFQEHELGAGEPPAGKQAPSVDASSEPERGGEGRAWLWHRPLHRPLQSFQ